MHPTRPQLLAVLAATERLLAAREEKMLTADEWSALEQAVLVCTEAPPATHDEAFSVDETQALVRRVVPENGAPYTHRCPKEAFEAIANAIDDLGEERFSGEAIAGKTGLPHTQVQTAFAFLKERGCVVPAFNRTHRSAAEGLFEDAMIEFHALREGEADQDVQGQPEAGPDGPAPTGA